MQPFETPVVSVVGVFRRAEAVTGAIARFCLGFADGVAHRERDPCLYPKDSRRDRPP